jgi:hypothetical protein
MPELDPLAAEIEATKRFELDNWQRKRLLLQERI